MNKKSLLGFFFISLLLASFIFSANLVVAQETIPTDVKEEALKSYSEGSFSIEKNEEAGYNIMGPDGKLLDIIYSAEETGSAPTPSSANKATTSNSWLDNLKNLRNVALIDLWLNGYSAKKDSISYAGEFVKIMLLILLVLLVYSSLDYANFLGENKGGTRFIISLIVGILATFLVSTEALLSSLTSFTALGTAIWIFLPILVLTFFTIMVASSAAPFGMLIQRILWLVYSVYTFLSGIVIFSLAQSKAGSGIAIFLNTYIVNPLYGGANSAVLTGMRTNADAPTAILLMVVSIMVFFIAVVKAPFAEAWLAKLARDEKIMKYQDEIEKAAAKRRTDAKDVDGK
ncbi:MAG: hypothetical protein AABX35_04530 [Nanoarchaeota archaeon]